MIQLFATLQVLSTHAISYLDDQVEVIGRAREDRGSITIEQVLWAVAIIALAGTVIGIVTSYVKGKANEIK
ncbi:MAG: hypothetical protein ACTMHL_01150 [Janibacter sp.]